MARPCQWAVCAAKAADGAARAAAVMQRKRRRVVVMARSSIKFLLQTKSALSTPKPEPLMTNENRILDVRLELTLGALKRVKLDQDQLLRHLGKKDDIK
jgi:hypothetical protein